MWHVICDMGHVTCDTWHVKRRDTWHVTREIFGGGWTLSQNFCSLALTVCDLSNYKSCPADQTKKSRNLSGQKIMPYFGPKKSLNLSGQKKSRNLLWKTEIKQPILTKKITQSLITKKITQPLGTEKSCNLLWQKNYATSRDNKKSRNLLGQIASKLVHKAPNYTKWHQMGPNKLE